MFKQILYTQWKWSRTELFLFVLAGFLVPTIIVRVGSSYIDEYAVNSMRGIGGYAGVFFMGLAFVSACALAWRPYVHDASLRHVGPLSLPVPWRAFVGMRFLAGAVLLIPPTIAVLFGGIAATAAVTMPPTLHAYPVGIAFRFLLSSLVAYAAAFCLQYFAGKNATRVAVICIVVVVVAELGASIAGYPSLLPDAWDLLTTPPGPFSTFGGAWRLIDV